MFNPSHLIPQTRDIDQDVTTLLRKDARHAEPVVETSTTMKPRPQEFRYNIQQTPLQAQRHGQFGFRDGLACFGDVDVENGSTRNFLQVGLGPKRRDQP